MAESRDRLSRPVEIDDLFVPRLVGTVGVYRDPDQEIGSNPLISRPIDTVSLGRGRGGLGTPRVQVDRGRNMFGTPARGSSGNRRGRGSNRALPYRYPRVPLRDITTIVRAYERRRALLGGSRAQETETPMPRGYEAANSSASSSSAHLEHNNNMKTPAPRTAVKRCPPSVKNVSKILLAHANEASEEGSEFLTPQKKLLNSIEKVEKEVMQELKKLTRTKGAKKAERERKVRTLMSFR
ncbi:uv-b-insensitive 4 [Euphorbia peplus]|nr:uv-b-insensitive 4 [Euphorbia peplus]